MIDLPVRTSGPNLHPAVVKSGDGGFVERGELPVFSRS